MQELPVDCEHALQQMVSERGNSVSPHCLAALSGLHLTIHKDRFAAHIMVKFSFISWFHNEILRMSYTAATSLQGYFSLLSLLQAFTSSSNWIWASSPKPSSKAALLTQSQWTSQGQTLWHHHHQSGLISSHCPSCRPLHSLTLGASWSYFIFTHHAVRSRGLISDPKCCGTNLKHRPESWNIIFSDKYNSELCSRWYFPHTAMTSQIYRPQ